MRNKKQFSAFFLAMIFSLICFSGNARDYYQIKVYTIKNKTQEATVDKYLKDAFIPALHKIGFSKVGVFKPMSEDKAAGTKIFVLIPLKKLTDIEKIEKKLAGDAQYLSAGKEYIDAPYDNVPYERIESILLRAFAKQPNYFVPEYKTPKSEQVFELRSYQGPTEKMWRKKVHMFNVGGETQIFKEVGSNAIFYGEVLSGSAMPNLMYLTTYENMKSNKAHWDAFRNHPDWNTLKSKPEYAHTVSHIDKWMCHPTDYSDF